MRSDADRVRDILDAIARINARMPVALDVFQADENASGLGHPPSPGDREAAGRVSQSLVEQHPEIPWAVSGGS
jgi:hypothetical protein